MSYQHSIQFFIFVHEHLIIIIILVKGDPEACGQDY